MVGGILGVALATAIVGAGVGLGLFGSQIRHRAQQALLSLHGDDEISRPALEDLAADLRRLRRAIDEVSDGTPLAKRDGLQLAYDDTLVRACDALEVPAHLTADLVSHALGPERDVSRLLIEQELTGAGLVLDPV